VRPTILSLPLYKGHHVKFSLLIRNSLLTVGLVFSLLACSSIPAQLDLPLEQPPLLTEVQADINAQQGKRVRWGGNVVSVNNYAQQTWLEIVARPLQHNNSRPQSLSLSAGRFIAIVDGFLDPLQFMSPSQSSNQPSQAGGDNILREVTLVGRVRRLESQKIGDYDYQFPLISVEALHIWSPRKYRHGDYNHYYSAFDFYPGYAYYPHSYSYGPTLFH
jgi:outer membrane lipoprotein